MSDLEREWKKEHDHNSSDGVVYISGNKKEYCIQSNLSF